MNEMVKMQWKGLDGRLVFDFTVNREPADGVPSLVAITCRSSPRETRHATITARPASLDARFPSGCYARGWLRQETPVHIDGVPNTAIFADIHYGCGPDDDHHFEGIMVACPARGPLPPPPPPWPPAPPAPSPIDPDPEVPIVAGGGEELFPYIYVRQWPKVPSQDLLWSFIQYAASSPPSSTFFADLIAARNTSRADAQALALRFIDGEPPYQGEFVSGLDELGGPVSRFAVLAAQLLKPDEDPVGWSVRAVERLNEVLTSFGLDWSYWSSPAYAQAMDRVWQSYFALVVTLGCDPPLLAQLVQALMMAHAIEVALLPAETSGVGMPPPVTAPQVKALCNATVVLPAQVFPLPPAACPQPSPPTGVQGWIEPYAIGELQMVRQRLVRYQFGEIARIENVMRGERREVTSKRTHRQVDELKQAAEQSQVVDDQASDARTSLQEQARRAVAEATVTNQYSNFTTSYGPPTQATLDGSWSQTLAPGATPAVEDAVRFAQDVLNRTVNRISRSVSVVRASSTMSQTEDSVGSVIDNTAGAGSLRAVFRWLNKVYEASVVNYGQRLMIEFMVRRPAAAWIAQQQALAGVDYVRPVPPSCLGVTTFDDIRRSNYAALGARYVVTDLEPPPPARRCASIALRGGEEKLLVVHEGYCATSAFVSCAGSAAPVVVVGRQTVTGGSAAAVAMNGEDGVVPVCVAETPPTLRSHHRPEAPASTPTDNPA